MRHAEDQSQIALVHWLRTMAPRYPLLGLAYHTPNGGYRDPRTAAKFRALGVRPGVWDIFVPVPAPGLWVEMKAGKNRLTPDQAKWRDALEPAGYGFVVCYDWLDAARAIGRHVGVPEDELPQ